MLLLSIIAQLSSMSDEDVIEAPQFQRKESSGVGYEDPEEPACSRLTTQPSPPLAGPSCSTSESAGSGLQRTSRMVAGTIANLVKSQSSLAEKGRLGDEEWLESMMPGATPQSGHGDGMQSYPHRGWVGGGWIGDGWDGVGMGVVDWGAEGGRGGVGWAGGGGWAGV